MKRMIILLLTLLLFPVTVCANPVALDDILSSLDSYSDEELDTLIQSASAEKAGRIREDVVIYNESLIDPSSVTSREDYTERAEVKRGYTGQEAKAIQEKLIEAGFLEGAADGNFGAKSEAATIEFQKANGLPGTGIADSVTQYLLFSDSGVTKEEYDSRPVASGDGWVITKDYRYTAFASYYYAFVLKNTGEDNVRITVDVLFYDAEDHIIGTQSASEDACESGYETFWSFSNEKNYDHVSIDVKTEPETEYKAGGQSSINLSYEIVGNKVILTAVNTGKKAVQYVEYHVLFLNDSDEVVSTSWRFLTDDDNEIKPGATEIREETSPVPFTKVLVYAHGTIEK